MTEQTDQIVIADHDMLVRMWLAEAVATGKMTQAAADKHWKGYSDNWHTVANYFSVADDAMLIASWCGKPASAVAVTSKATTASCTSCSRGIRVFAAC